MTRNDLNIHLKFENVDEKDVYVKLDLLLQFMFKNKLNGSVVLNRSEYQFDDGED